MIQAGSDRSSSSLASISAIRELSTAILLFAREPSA